MCIRDRVWEEYSGAEGQDEEEKKISADRSVLKASAIWQTMKAVSYTHLPRWGFDSLEALPSAANTCMRLGKPAKISVSYTHLSVSFGGRLR